MSKFISSTTIAQLAEKSLDFHCHGVGRFDFTEILELDLQEIEDILVQKKQRTILTLYLPEPNFRDFLTLMDFFYKGKETGKFFYIEGFSLEGPLLASHGGTPEKGVWVPTKQQWKELAACGEKGLIYTILSPDAQLAPQNIEWIIETLLEGGVLPAPGHFTKTNPTASARALKTIFDIVAAWGHGPTITDHLFNDMPHNFKHAWRTPEERAKRDQEIELLDLEHWSLDSLDKHLGPVPAVMIRAARKGLVKICQNFDGEHVDLAIVKKAVELIGAENMILMTDSIESKKLAGRQLHTKEDSTLLYQEEDIVAAGSSSVPDQIENMFKMGLTLTQISLITNLVPTTVIKQRNKYINEHIHAKTTCY